MDADSHKLFHRWVEEPFSALRRLPNGDGAFAALAMAFGLYERFLDSKVHSQGEKISPDRRAQEAHKDLEKKVSADDFASFWEMYRVGIQHFFQPKHFTKGKDKTRWGWEISENKGYDAFPLISNPETNLYIICIDPWKFVEHVIKRWKDHPELMNEISAFAFGKISELQSTPYLPRTDFSTGPSRSAEPKQVNYDEGRGSGNYPIDM